MVYGALSLLLSIIAVVSISSASNTPSRMYDLGFGLVLFSTVIAAFQAARNGSPVLSILIVLSTTLGICAGIVFPLPTYPNENLIVEAIVISVLVGVFMGSTGQLAGQSIADVIGDPPVELSRNVTVATTVLLVASLVAIILQFPL